MARRCTFSFLESGFSCITPVTAGTMVRIAMAAAATLALRRNRRTHAG
jgi:hypothetical protein